MNGMKRLQEAVDSYDRTPRDEKEVARGMKAKGYTLVVLFSRNNDWDNMYVKTQAQAAELLRRDFPGDKTQIVPIDTIIQTGQVGF